MKPKRIIDYETEYFKVRKNNIGLAQALAEQKQLNKKLQDENNFLQKKLHISSSLNMQYDKKLSDLLEFIKQNVNCCVDLSSNLTKMLYMCNEKPDLKKDLDSDNINDYKVDLRSNSPGNSQKTQAVKPMVSGHVIHHPTINLSRLTQFTFTGFENSLQNNDASSPNNGSNNHEFLNDSIPNENFSPVQDIMSGILQESHSSDEDSVYENNSDFGLHRSLEPILEQSDENNSPPSLNNSLREARVLLEPLSWENINVNPRNKNEKPRKRAYNEDPLEGTSSMLDNLNNGIHSRPRKTFRKIVYSEPDSDDSSEANSEHNESGSNERSKRRTVPKSLAEPSLKRKLRR